MATEQTPPGLPQPTSPLNRDSHSPGAWNYVVNYILLGLSSVLIVMEIVENEALRKVCIPLLLLLFAVANLSRLQAADRKHT